MLNMNFIFLELAMPNRIRNSLVFHKLLQLFKRLSERTETLMMVGYGYGTGTQVCCLFIEEQVS